MPIMRHNGNTTAIKNCLSSQMREALVSPIRDKGSELSLLMRGALIAGSPDPGTPDHPRGCGEHVLIWTPARVTAGSFHRMRGAPRDDPGRAASTRIIPADAGSTVSVLMVLIMMKDHPRGCGEHAGGHDVAARMEGSSPRMRGARHERRQGHLQPGIIPADAGSTLL